MGANESSENVEHREPRQKGPPKSIEISDEDGFESERHHHQKRDRRYKANLQMMNDDEIQHHKYNSEFGGYESQANHEIRVKKDRKADEKLRRTMSGRFVKTGFTLLGFTPHFLSIMWTILGINIALLRVVADFNSLVTKKTPKDGSNYLTVNMVNISLSAGALSTCLAVFYKLDFLRLAYKKGYKELWHWLIGWFVLTCGGLFWAIFFAVWCAPVWQRTFSLIVYLSVAIGCPFIAKYRYLDDKRFSGSDEKQIKLHLMKDKYVAKLKWVNKKIGTSSVCEACRTGFFDIVVLFFSCVSFALGSVGIIVGYHSQMTGIFGWNSCKSKSSLGLSYDDYISIIVAGCFVCASAIGKIAGANFRHRGCLFNGIFTFAILGPALIIITYMGLGTGSQALIVFLCIGFFMYFGLLFLLFKLRTINIPCWWVKPPDDHGEHEMEDQVEQEMNQDPGL